VTLELTFNRGRCSGGSGSSDSSAHAIAGSVRRRWSG